MENKKIIILKTHLVIRFYLVFYAIIWVFGIYFVWKYFENVYLWFFLINFYAFYLLFLYNSFLNFMQNRFVFLENKIWFLKKDWFLNNKIEFLEFSKIIEIKSINKWFLSNYLNYWKIVFITQENKIEFDFIQDNKSVLRFLYKNIKK